MSKKAESKGDDDIHVWISKIYDIAKYTEDDFIALYDAYKYKGFERMEVLKALKLKIADPEIVIHAIIVCALNGPVRASQTKLKNGKTLQDMGIPASVRGEKNVSCGRITAATADLAAFFLKKFNCPKKIDSELPGWLQFPSAASIKMPENLRSMHKQFSINFSKIIGGEFNESIYNTMVQNSYVDDKLRLF